MLSRLKIQFIFYLITLLPSVVQKVKKTCTGDKLNVQQELREERGAGCDGWDLGHCLMVMGRAVPLDRPLQGCCPDSPCGGVWKLLSRPEPPQHESSSPEKEISVALGKCK